MTKKIKLRLKKKGYDIFICYNSLDKLGGMINSLKLGSDAVIITNPAIKKLFGEAIRKSLLSEGLSARFEIIPDAEKSKSERYCLRLLNKISEFDSAKRRIFIVALGGGVVGDLAGFVASIYRRGIPYVQVPTTLLAQVDSAIGGKVAIDLKVGKNLAGSFYQPRLVFSDVSTLNSLPAKDLVSGLAEVVKYGVIRSPELFRILENNYKKILKRDRKILEKIIQICSLIKASVVEKDEFDDKGIRVILNFGHTIGHAIEAASQYSKAFSHGEAIALGMISASRISMRLGLLPERAYLRIKDLIIRLGLPTTLEGLNIQDILSAQGHDKKFIHGKNRFVLPVKIGKVITRESIPISIIKESITALYESQIR